MKFLALFLAVVASALAGTVYMGLEREKALSDRLSSLEAGFQRAEAALNTKVEQQLAGIDARVTPQEVARRIIEGNRDALIAEIAKRLTDDTDAVTKLKGQQGKPGDQADVGEVARALVQSDLADQVAKGLWAQKRRLLTEDPATIAEVADVVYTKYGNDLTKALPSADAIAVAVAKEPGFADLVAAAAAQRQRRQ